MRETIIHAAACFNYWRYFSSVRAQLAEWLDSEDGAVVANVLIVMIQRAMAMLSGQVRRLGDDFQQEGGFRERMHKCRVEVREAQDAAPACPDCGQPMRLRTAHAGSHAGEEFWGCRDYPNCKGRRRKEEV